MKKALILTTISALGVITATYSEENKKTSEIIPPHCTAISLPPAAESPQLTTETLNMTYVIIRTH